MHLLQSIQDTSRNKRRGSGGSQECSVSLRCWGAQRDWVQGFMWSRTCTLNVSRHEDNSIIMWAESRKHVWHTIPLTPWKRFGHTGAQINQKHRHITSPNAHRHQIHAVASSTRREVASIKRLENTGAALGTPHTPTHLCLQASSLLRHHHYNHMHQSFTLTDPPNTIWPGKQQPEPPRLSPSWH